MTETYIAAVCMRPLYAGEHDRDKLRKNDPVRCLCGRPTCRDVDVKGDRRGSELVLPDA